MKELQNISSIYFLGIGGIGMSALARYAHANGYQVAGYDLTRTELTDALEKEGIDISYSEKAEQIPSYINKNTSLIVRTPAVPLTHEGYNFLEENNFRIIKRSEMLGILTRENFCIAVAGTHGKTSVSTMVAHLLNSSNKKIGAFLGGISRNFNSNLVLPDEKQQMVITEADEFDRSFLQLTPDFAVITSIDPDHLDIYGDYEKVKQSFSEFVGKIKSGGALLYKAGLDIPLQNINNQSVYTYTINGQADFIAQNIRIDDGAFWFDLKHPGGTVHDIKMNYPGRLNVENMVAALAVGLITGCNNQSLKSGVETFEGVKRRFDVRYNNEQVIYIDDYAHHPAELEATIRSVKELYRDKKVLGVFQPHLFSRTKDFSSEFAESLDLLDETLLLQIYPAREQPIEGVDSKLVLDKMKNRKCAIVEDDNLINVLKNKNFDVLLTLGAGNIDRFCEPIVTMLTTK